MSHVETWGRPFQAVEIAKALKYECAWNVPRIARAPVRMERSE